MAETDDLTRWIAEAKAGDDHALQLLLLRHYDPLLRFVNNRFGAADLRRAEAEDIVQQTHQHVFRSIHQFRGTTSNEFQSWMYQICRTTLADYRRANNSAKRSGSRQRVALPGSNDSSFCLLWNDVQSDDATPSRTAISREEQEQLKTAMEKLSDDEVRLIEMRYVEQRTQCEIAEVVGVSRSTIAKKCEATLKRIQRIIAGIC